jgi:hypothetical protein
MKEAKGDTTTMQALKTAIAATIILCGPAAIPGLLALLITHNDGYVGNDTFMGATITDMVAMWWIWRRLALPPEEE